MNATIREVEAQLLARWPETRLEPSLTRIRALCELLGEPQSAAPVIQLTGTNGKSSTSRMIDALVRSLGLRTGRFTSPHLQRINERIDLDGEPLSDEDFVRVYEEVTPFARMVDERSEHPLSFFEMMVAMAYAAFADAPVDASIIEVGMGGAWDATSVADAKVAVITSVKVDHAEYLGDSPELIAAEKSGIIKPGGRAVFATQQPEVLDVLMARAMEVGAPVVREGVDFGVESRVPAVGGQQFTLAGLGGRYEDILLPLHGAHQARNAALALATVETFTGGDPLDVELVREAFGTVRSPGRLEVVRRGPTVLLDAAHNPDGVATMLATVQQEFSFSPLVGVLGMMADKDVDEMIRLFEPVLAHVVCTQNASDRCMPAEELARLATDVFGSERVSVAPRLDDAIAEGIERAESAEGYEDAIGSGGVLVTGSVVTAGEARTLLGAVAEERP